MTLKNITCQVVDGHQTDASMLVAEIAKKGIALFDPQAQPGTSIQGRVWLLEEGEEVQADWDPAWPNVTLFTPQAEIVIAHRPDSVIVGLYWVYEDEDGNVDCTGGEDGGEFSFSGPHPVTEASQKVAEFLARAFQEE